jgi:hypothetical protein
VFWQSRKTAPHGQLCEIDYLNSYHYHWTQAKEERHLRFMPPFLVQKYHPAM